MDELGRDAEIQARVHRERASHDEDDVLAQSQALKDRFSHVRVTPGFLRMEKMQDDLIAGMAGQTVLDYGCGRGEMSLRYLAAGAADVQGIDISSVYVTEAQENCSKAGHSNEQAHFQVMDAHALEFADNTFDWVIGRGILHHLNLDVAASEVKRVLKPGGRAAFLEPLADNPLLKLFRFLTPKARTADEAPLTLRDLKTVLAGVDSETYYFGILSAPTAMVTSVLMPSKPDNALLKLSDRAEQAVNNRHWLDHWNQYALLVFRSPA